MGAGVAAPITTPAPALTRLLVTGSEGFIGTRISEAARLRGYDVAGCDVQDDILNPLWSPSADVAIHLAAHKHAPMGEDHPVEVADLNIRGTQAVVEKTPKVVLASTCKAANPITAYGASKLIAERIVLNAGGWVVRLVNVLGSSGSVTAIWDDIEGPLPVTDTERYFISPEQAVSAFLDVLELPPGRYAPRLDSRRHMDDVAAELYPGRPTYRCPLRRGDRPVERLLNDYETATPVSDSLVRIDDCWGT
jgi:FlaA1/EpsC-like NDP-sugar epimerase